MADKPATFNLEEALQLRERVKTEESEVGQMLAKYLSGGAVGLNFIKAAGTLPIIALYIPHTPRKYLISLFLYD